MNEFSLKRYLIIYILIVVALIAMSFVLPVPSGLPTILPCMMAALMEGQRIAKETNAPIEKSDAWAIAVRATLAVLVVNLVILGLMLLTELGAILLSMPLWLPLVILLVLMLVVFLANRFFLTMGANGVLKAAGRAKK